MTSAMFFAVSKRGAVRAALLIFSLVFARAGLADTNWPADDYDPAIPTIEGVLGYSTGERITWSHDVRRYFDALAMAAPKRVRIIDYGRSWEGRELFYVVISSPDNIAAADATREGMHALRDPRGTSSTEAERLISELAPPAWLAYGVHGNEISSTDAAMMTAYHLLASREDPRVPEILNSTTVILNPMQNPDGRDRFIHRFESALGLEPSSDRISAEHNEPWPSGRTNHYLFDLNRDWFIRSQPETRGHADAVFEWLPVAFVDLHEMGSDSTYYFAPEAVPYNPHLAADQRASLELFGRTNAKWFDEFGLDYFTREVYDAFYPGYGASWPAYFGSVAMTYEQASARGLIVRQYDGVELPYADTVRNHFLTSLGTLETVASNREKLLRDFYNYQRTAVSEGSRGEVQAYVVPAQNDQNAVDRLGALLASQGVEVGRASESFKACGADFDANSLVINLDQPAKRFLRTLMDRETPMDPQFVVEQERLNAKNLPDEMYDITAWSLPLLLNIESVSCKERVAATVDMIAPGAVPTPDLPAKASVSYLVPWGERSAIQLLSHALRDGLAVKSSDKPFVHGGETYPGGTLIIDVADNSENLHEHLVDYVKATRARVVAVNDSWVTEGPSFGSRKVVRMNAPRIALAWDEPTSSYSAGNFRFVVERQFGYPVTAIRFEELRKEDLSRYQVLVLPDTYDGYADALGESGKAHLRDWVERGGVLISLARATRLLADPEADLLASRREYRLELLPEEETPDGEEARVPGTALDKEAFETATESREAAPDGIGGAQLLANVDGDHWLGAGVAPQLHVLARTSDVYTPLRLNEGTNVVTFADADDILASGHLWERNKNQLAYKPFAMARKLGKGQVIAFTQDPTVRAYQEGLNVIVANAIFRGAAHARPLR
ncbi:M14 family zinc carboxypeptidase [Congregibacter litoralis]|uniref:Zinc carboxypeptidase n=1 Tax=Congregibacter litoralis KT71 TaxID=314285 RepID=A4A7H5_9GAMM|nr:M14 family zinc carboxypeptidase [Congregibacter litoralis]EAQ98244.2 Zinc carboxypeptidase [Congregibacter litoralis KT71]